MEDKFVLQLAARQKCAGCKALIPYGKSFGCQLNVSIVFDKLHCGRAIAPKPKKGEKCYKPKTFSNLKYALAHIDK